MMNFPINSASQNRKYFISPQTTAVKYDVTQKNDTKKNNISGKTKTSTAGWVGLSALAVIGAASVLISRAVKGKNTVPPVASEPVVKLSELKAKIKADYQDKKNEILNTSDLNINNEEIQKYRERFASASTSVKNKLKKLAEDSDWTDLRKIRKNLLQTLEVEKHGEKHDIAEKKFELLNNVLICKINPEEEEAFRGKFLMDISDAAELIKKDFTTFSDFQKEYLNKQKYEFDFDLNEKFFYKIFKLTLRDLFPEDMKEYDLSKEKIRELYDEPKKKLHEKLKSLAQDFRASGDVKTLKNLNASKK